jgi:hypothetical protein
MHCSCYSDTMGVPQDVLAPFRFWEWAHEINPPHIKDFNFDVDGQRHHVHSIDVPMLRISDASSNERLTVLIHGRPIESTLPHFYISAECSIVATIWR